MSFPAIYDPSKVGTRYMPDIQGAIAAGMKSGLPHVTPSEVQRLGLFIDYQNDFLDYSDGLSTLPVPGSVQDVRRACEWLYINAPSLTGLMLSLDQHIPFQIFFVTWWKDQSGNAPDPYTLITADDVESGKWIPRFDKDWSIQYVKDLGAIMVWTFHCMIGTPGAALNSSLAEAIAWVAAARNIQPTYIFKGTVPQSEHYGPFEPCKIVTNHPQGGTNTAMLEAMNKYNEIYWFGEAEEYCVDTGKKQVLSYYSGRPDVIARMRFVTDCTSLVFPDKRAEADAVQAEYVKQGVVLVKSTDPIAA